MSDVDVNGRTGPGTLRPFSEVSKGYTLFERGDVLVAKITPCFQNGKIAQAATASDIAAGSTEFHVVRAVPGVADPRYILHFLRQPYVRSAGERRMTGSGGQRRVPEAFLRELQILLPPIEEQRRIAAILDQADELRAKRQASLALLDSLNESIFLEMFGDPSANPQSHPVRPLSEIASTTSGGTPDRSRPDLYGGAIPWVKSGELRDPVVLCTEETITSQGLKSSSAKLMPPGTILLAMYGATAGAVATLGIEAATNQAVCCISLGRSLLPTYLVQCLRVLMPTLLRQRVGGAQPNLSQALVRAFQIPIPPMALQEAFAERRYKVEAIGSDMATSSQRSEELATCLQHQAFAGQL